MRMLHKAQLGAVAFSILLLFPAIPPTAADLVNRTIDDQKGNATPIYFPTGPQGWKNGQTCTTCTLPPSSVDLTQVRDGTWKEGTYTGDGRSVALRFSFHGSALYVYNIIPNMAANNASAVTNLTFGLDDADVGAFTHEPDGTSTILYNVLVYQNDTLPDGPHTFHLGSAGASAATILFDYAVYTTTIAGNTSASSSSAVSSTDEPLSTSPNSPPMGSTGGHDTTAIVGGIVGGIVALLLVIACALFLRRRRRPLQVPETGGNAPRGSLTEPRNQSTDPMTTVAPYHYDVLRAASSTTAPSASRKRDLVLNSEEPLRAQHPAALDSPLPLPSSTHTEAYANLSGRIQALHMQVTRLESIRSSEASVSSSGPSSRPPAEDVWSDQLVALRNEIAVLQAALAERNFDFASYSDIVPPSYSA
ncbi:hypothetical protein C8Q79DRAFT_1011004 [Trametes meyenii]|nr:hypothetical protein C8Q79DRAFT_1011004 [Trametes meyenii]